ncbi:MAG TPA: DNA repair protein RadA [Anaerolineae bacterium]|nr:DNA repair protein RadA [Anaerolineae bacterium]
MSKRQTRFVCQECGAVQPTWMGRCPDCWEWNTFVETMVESESRSPPSVGSDTVLRNPPRKLSEVRADELARIPVPLVEFSRVLGGGIVPGSLVLIGGDPGIGKSTLLLQVSALLAQNGGKILYVSGEESAQQIKMRAHRLSLAPEGLYVLTETNLHAIIEHMGQLRPTAVVVDSIQTVYRDELSSAAGSISQVRECAALLMRTAKAENVPIFLVGHVTKAGAIAGPRVLEHIVDTVLYLEGDRFHAYRLLRSVKNRFGATSEVGVFEMKPEGLVEVLNPSAAFLEERLPNASGSAIGVTMEGTRPIMVEFQALSSTTAFGNPRRTANGIDFNRLLLLIAVLSKRVGLQLSDQDVFVNVIGGLTVTEPAADLAVAVAIASGYRNKPVAADIALVGEIGLSGELRSVGQIEARLNEAAKLGFKRCILPRALRRAVLREPPIELLTARSLADAVELALVH